VHQLYLMCDDIARFTADMTKHGIPFSTPQRQSWGTVTEITLPGGGTLGVYQPHHKRPTHGAAEPPKNAPQTSPPRAKPRRKAC